MIGEVKERYAQTMDSKRLTQLSKFLSLVLRHRPETVGVVLDRSGWVAIDELLAACKAHGKSISTQQLGEIVATSTKKRFAVSDDGKRIRANQGHSVEVDLGYKPSVPPEILFHGTVKKFLPAIRKEGLRKMSRHHVHLSADEATARTVGSRRGLPVLLRIAAGAMHRDGLPFYRSENGVWLTEHVPPERIDFSDAQ
jgi:putative RNA 2'-phosphotransferase